MIQYRGIDTFYFHAMQILLLVAAFIYFFLPIDFLPDAFGPFGRIDDIAVLVFALYQLRKAQAKESRAYYRQAQTEQGSDESGSTKSQQNADTNKTSSDPSPYRVLGVEPDDDQATIEKAYKDLARKYHPDKVAHLGEDLQKVANSKMAEITNAYQTLRLRKSA